MKENTLVVYIENRDLPETPFLSGFGFQYALRYLYEENAIGLIDHDRLLYHRWEVTDAGFEITPDAGLIATGFVGAKHSQHGWDEIIFLVKDSEARVHILEEIPPAYYTPERQAHYDPQGRIEHSFVAPRIREVMPPIQSVEPILLPESNR
jgi:hypothetical protein